MPGMSKFGSWLLASTLLLPASLLVAQKPDAPAEDPRAVEKIQGVPPPEIPLGSDAAAGLTMPDKLKIVNEGGEITGDDEQRIHFGGPLKINGDNGLEIFADKGVLDLKQKIVTLTGNVSTYQGDVMQRGDKAVYYYETGRLVSDGMRASYDPVLLEANRFTTTQVGDKMVLVGRNAGLTTDDQSTPGYWLRAKETRVYPEEKITFRDLKVYVGDVPVFWLPYLAQPLDSELGYHFIPGSKSSWGPYLLNTYGIMLGGEVNELTGDRENAWLLSKWHFDLRTTRGMGFGVDLADINSERSEEINGLSLYYLNDLDPSYSRSGAPRGFVNEDRYSLGLHHRIHLEDLEPGADWRLDFQLTHLSDTYYLEDLQEDLYRRDPSPDNTIGLYRRTDESLLSFYTRYQVNDFYRSDSRLPEIIWDNARKPLFEGLPLLHEGSISLGLLGERGDAETTHQVVNPLSGMLAANPAVPDLLDELSGYERLLAEEMVSLPLGDPRREEIRRQLVDSRFTRFHAYEELSLPMMLGNVLSVTPRAGVGYTNYGMVDGPGDGFDRLQMHAGLEASLKFTRDYGDVSNRALGLDGLMHVIQPYADWSLVSSNRDYTIGDPAIDRLTPTTRPRPLDPLRFTAIDQMEDWNVVRTGVRNRFITHRDDQSYEWLYLNTYIDCFTEDPEGDRNISNLYNDLSWRPVPWMNFDVETQLPLASKDSNYSEFLSRARFMPNDQFEFSLIYRWLNGHPFLRDSSRLNLQTYTRLNQEWGFGTSHHVELDDNTLEYQQYTLHRDLGQWVAGLGFSMRDSRLKQEYGLVLMLTLKDFPSLSLPFEYAGE